MITMQEHLSTHARDKITDILESLISEIPGEQLTLEQIMDNLNHRGFGPILALLALFVIIVGAIPLIPAFIGIIISVMCIQMLMGYTHPRLPKFLQNYKISKSKLHHIIVFIKPYTKKLERLLKTRYTFFFNRLSEIITALTCLTLAICMICIGFIPFLPAILCAPILMFGIAYTLQDGLLVIIGFIIVFGACWFMFVH